MSNDLRRIQDALGEMYKSEGRHYGAREAADEFMELAMRAFQGGDDEKAQMYRMVADRIKSMAHQMSVQHNEMYRASGIEAQLTNELWQIVKTASAQEMEDNAP
jgi:hypothetical protein